MLLRFGVSCSCLFIQFVQLYSVRTLLADDTIKQVSEIDKWVAEGLLDWANGKSSSYNDTNEIDFLATLRDGTLVLTEEGSGFVCRNQLVGIAVLCSFLVAEINAIIFKNAYPFKLICLFQIVVSEM